MNRRMIFHLIGKILQVEALLLIVPAVVSLIYKESSLWAFLFSSVITVLVGTALVIISRPKSSVIYARDGLIIVALAWLCMSLFGALPFYISREIPSYVDAFFEIVSGFTTTGSSILKNVEALSHGCILWRSLSQWLGGMGVLVFVTAVIPNLSDRAIHIIRAEMPGPIVGKLVPRVKDTSRVLYLIYIVLTALEVIMLLFSGLDLFESSVLSFSTTATGGFSVRLDGMASYSPYVQWVITVFMFLSGINFNLYYLCIIKRFSSAIKSEELWTYISMVLASVGIITVNTLSYYNSLSDTIRHAAFQVSSIITTTGYGSVDFNLWPSVSKAVLLILMFTGACAGSTAGGFKLSRVIIIFKTIKNECQRLVHPRSVRSVKFEGKALDHVTRHGVTAYLGIYMVCILAIFLLISVDNFSLEANFSAAVSCFNNIGPGFDAVGPMSSFADYSNFSKIILSFAMLLGRLEIYPLLLIFSIGTWKKNR
ncbi:MAG: TrkH family potassium uptake protein [Acutalibacteraceae bacterium]|nr:TrkH family potassium uptake protein [Acutalibacteraceae bacterium]